MFVFKLVNFVFFNNLSVNWLDNILFVQFAQKSSINTLLGKFEKKWYKVFLVIVIN